MRTQNASHDPQSPFPGMDPYLEAQGLWPDVHASLMNIFREQLSSTLAPKYVAELETQIVIERMGDEEVWEASVVLPDVAVTQPEIPSGAQWAAEDVAAAAVSAPPLRLIAPMDTPTRLVTLHIRRREPDRLVAVIELLSPVNKRPGNGRQDYLEKRAAYLRSSIHFIEIDLLRRWPRMPFGGPMPDVAYLAAVCDMRKRPACDAWPIRLRDPLPVLPVPLLSPDPPVSLDMGQALRTAYQRARYDLRIDYDAPPPPPLSPEEEAWINGLLSTA